MNPTIKPKYKDGEPVCDEENCTAATEGDCDWPLDMLMDSDKKPCIPALHRDRDQAMKERDEARRLICQMCSTTAQDSDYYNHVWTKEQEAEKRGLPDIFEGGE